MLSFRFQFSVAYSPCFCFRFRFMIQILCVIVIWFRQQQIEKWETVTLKAVVVEKTISAHRSVASIAPCWPTIVPYSRCLPWIPDLLLPLLLPRFQIHLLISGIRDFAVSVSFSQSEKCEAIRVPLVLAIVNELELVVSDAFVLVYS